MQRITVENIQDTRIKSSLENPLSLYLHANQAFALKGPNGSGKTSLLRMLCHIIEPQKGYIIHHQAQMHSYLPNAIPLYPQVKVQHYIKTFHDPFIQHLEEKKNSPVGLLSSGQQKIIALFLYMNLSKNIWIFDEPTTFLDTHKKENFYQKVFDFIENGGSIVMSTHDITPPFFKTITL